MTRLRQGSGAASAPALHRRLAAFSALIYLPDWAEVERGVARLGGRLMGYRDHGDSEAMFVMGGSSPIKGSDPASGQADDVDQFAALVFRGTEASRAHWRDLIDNLGVASAWAGAGRAHSGYATGLARARYGARQWAEKLPRTVPLYVSGHSMGGAIATLFANWYYTDSPEGYRLAGLVTFGAPKALDRAGCAAIPPECPIFRYAIPLDFAPYWPPSCRLTHPAPAIAPRSALRWPGPVSRHDIDNYVASLAGIRDQRSEDR